jgi:uncharacterized protein (DUF58 family)
MPVTTETLSPEQTALLDGYRWGSGYLFAEPPHSSLGTMGEMVSRNIGSSLEFMEHREYLPGDDLRRIDWNAYARSDRLVIKMFREEVHPHVDLLLDGSRSMKLNGTSKANASLALAALFASAAAESHFSFTCYMTGDGCKKLERSNSIPTEWEQPTFDSNFNPSESLTQMPPDWKSRGIRVFISDLLFPEEPSTVIARIAANSAITIIVQLLATADIEPPGQGNVRLVDTETNERLEIYLDTTLRERYKKNLLNHQTQWHESSRRHNTKLITINAEEFLKTKRVDGLVSAEILRFK